MKKLIFVVSDLIRYYNDRQIPLASAALSYYLTMTFFPLVICLYTLLGRNYDWAMEILEFAESFLRTDTVQTIRSFLSYVAGNYSTLMFYAGLTVLLTSASAGVRSMMVTIGRMQEQQRYYGLASFLFSLLFAVEFIVAVYFGILVMFTSRDLLNLLNEKIPFLDISRGWLLLKYIILGALLFLILFGIYSVSRPKGSRLAVWPGAILATLEMVAISLVFSSFIYASARYSLVYGSMASVILLMYWMYLECQNIYLGAAFNLAISDLHMEEIV